ncbi:hypothetical protein NDU88_000784 [Pleurodeles waltl]|uniref:Uncharacterized protein n=1 Tax=Pleurodeles waltl TaxID=8319 RepID=A0AAV7V7U3_PLEWA|nr:hypothetical protein NDU88_000784 [Pleurodeles waltl]
MVAACWNEPVWAAVLRLVVPQVELPSATEEERSLDRGPKLEGEGLGGTLRPCPHLLPPVTYHEYEGQPAIRGGSLKFYNLIILRRAGLTRARTGGARYRTIIARIYKHRDTILQAARTVKMPSLGFFSDYTLQVQKQRHSFDEVKKILRAKKLKYMMLFSAKLRVLAEGESWYFTTPV